MGLFQNDLGIPSGYDEWLVGDESQYRLAAYNAGFVVDLDSWELEIMERVTNPSMDIIFRPEESKFTGRTAMALYVRHEQMGKRWGDETLSSPFAPRIGI